MPFAGGPDIGLQQMRVNSLARVARPWESLFQIVTKASHDAEISFAACTGNCTGSLLRWTTAGDRRGDSEVA